MTAAHELPVETGDYTGIRDGSPLSLVRVTGEAEEGFVNAIVPLELVRRTDVPVDEDRVQELMAMIQDDAERGFGTGQAMPVYLGEVKTEDELLLIDGFHRTEALYRLGRTDLNARIRLNTTMEEVADQRIFASNHSKVSFARLATWIGDSWSTTDWAPVEPRAFEALQIARGKITNTIFQRAELAEITKWFKDKCDGPWAVTFDKAIETLTIASQAKPELVHQVRDLGESDEFALTADHVAEIIAIKCTQDSAQLLLGEFTKKHELDIATTRAMVKEINRINRHKAVSFGDVAEALQSIGWLNPQPDPQTGKQVIIRPIANRVRSPGFGNTVLPFPQRPAVPALSPQPVARPQPAVTARPRQPISAGGEISARRLLQNQVQLARSALRAFVLEGAYLAPKTPDKKPLFVVDTSQDPEIKRLCMPANTVANGENFFEFAGAPEVQQGFIHSIAKKTDADGPTINNIYRTATLRVSSAIEKGDLRFIAGMKRPTFHMVLARCIGDQLQSRQALPVAEPEGSWYKSSHSERVITLDEVLEGLPRLSDPQALALIYKGLLGVSTPTVAQVMGTGQKDVVGLAQGAAVAVLSNVR